MSTSLRNMLDLKRRQGMVAAVERQPGCSALTASKCKPRTTRLGRIARFAGPAEGLREVFGIGAALLEGDR